MHRSTLPLALAALALAGCLGSAPNPESAGASPGQRSSTSRIVIPVEERATPPSLLYLLSMRVRNMDIRRSSGACPQIEFRGRNSVSMPTPPSVYVDGQHASNTCILELISPVDVAFLEVYPMGVSNRPGYFSNSGGLILVFTRDGRQ